MHSLKSLFVDAQNEKDKIIQELSLITPSPFRDLASPETQEKIHALTQQLERLKSTNAPIAFTAYDYVEQGKALYFEGRYEEAITTYDRAIQMQPNHAIAWFSRGVALAKLHQFEEAVQSYDQAIQTKPDFLEAWFSRGSVLARLQHLETAIESYEKVTQMKPDFYLAWFGIARCYALQNNLELALGNLEKAIELNADKCKDAAKTDSAFDSIRETDQFKHLIN
ncbi:MAG: tetratricopeptide repeat protein [Cyanobacteria bacterium CRU_2_1]|nr:tetratricopeptide repeat protein [Cyanobacteria bacterium RU_5_0]NJR63450.1 tetratricopeptide repeat protein [Cyanobacteria bacterium CRU_2_1]